MELYRRSRRAWPSAQGNVLHAEGRFEHRRYQAELRWQPTTQQIEQLVDELVKTKVPRNLARRLLITRGSPRSPRRRRESKNLARMPEQGVTR